MTHICTYDVCVWDVCQVNSVENIENWQLSLIIREVIAIRLEAIAITLEAIAPRLEAIAIRLEAIAPRLEAIALRLEAIAFRLEAIASWTLALCQVSPWRFSNTANTVGIFFQVGNRKVFTLWQTPGTWMHGRKEDDLPLETGGEVQVRCVRQGVPVQRPNSLQINCSGNKAIGRSVLDFSDQSRSH